MIRVCVALLFAAGWAFALLAPAATSEVVTVEDFETMLAFAQKNHLARFTFWAVNRDRPCSGSETPGEDCSGIARQPYAFTDVIARY